MGLTMVNDNNILNQYKESKRIIRQAMDEHQLVLFVGAGASIASGMPSWKDAIKIIANRLSIKDDQLDYLKIPQYYYARGKKEYNQLMRKIFRHGDLLEINKIHDKIFEFTTETIITTNYDHLIEQAAEAHSQVLSIVSKNEDLSYRKGGIELIKMHGDFENGNYVLKEDDYLTYSENFKLIENYVKSIIGTKVVLFIGYSFNDPDLKQIFSWVKDILGEDFQRAYLIEAGKSYDINEAEYFRNFGINILYSSVQLQFKHNAEDVANNLLSMLDWLLTPEENDKLTRLYNELKPFLDMKYASQKYVNEALNRAGISSADGKLTIHDTLKLSDEETQDIFKALAYEQWIRLNKNIVLPDYYFELNTAENIKKEKQENNNKKAEEYFKDYKPNKDKKDIISKILDVLNNSNILYMEGQLPGPNSQFEWRPVTIPLKNADSFQWMDYVNTFNYTALENIAKNNNAYLTETNPELYMEQGYIQFVLGEYLFAYNCFKNAKSVFYKKREYIKFFIAEFNRYVLGKMISRARGVLCGVDTEDADRVYEEVNAIDLDKIFNSLPDLGETNKALKDIYTFNVAYTLFQDAYRIAEKMNIEAQTQYFLYGGTAAFAGMRESISDYYRYISLNLLAVNNYSEHVNVFRIYFQSIVNSVTIKDEKSLVGVGKETYNIHANELLPFDIMIGLKFVDNTNIEKLLQGVLLKLPLSKEAIEYLSMVIGNCYRKPSQSFFMYDETFWKCITIIGYSNLSEALVEIVLQKMKEIVGGTDYQRYADVISRLIINAHKQKRITDSALDYLTEFLEKALQDQADNTTEVILKSDFVRNILWVMKENGKIYNNKEFIAPLLCNELSCLAVEMYEFVDENCRKLIYDKYNNWSLSEEHSDISLYYNLVRAKIIRPNIIAEKFIFEYYSKNENVVLESGFVKVFPNPKEQGLHQLLNLYIQDLIIDKETCRQIIHKYNKAEADWLINYRDFDYNNFDASWLGLCSNGLLADIFKEKDIKEKVKSIIEKEYKEGNTNKRVLDIYFRWLI